jgi:hypothetical protein
VVLAEVRDMEAMNQMKLETLKARIGNADYEIDADAVAEAIVRRLLARRDDVRQPIQTLEGTTPIGNGQAFETA